MTLSSEIRQIADNSKNSDDIDIAKISTILNQRWADDEIQTTIIMLINMMSSNSKSLICLELIQYMISMCKIDIIEILSNPITIAEMEHLYPQIGNKGFKDDFLKFIENICLENKNNFKYKNLLEFYYSLKPENRPKNILQNDSFEDDIQRAIKLSLETTPRNMNDSQVGPIKQPPRIELDSLIQALVLFDFAAEEPGELTIKTGETITIIEKSNESWWKGQIGARVGLFPSNFVKIKNSQDQNQIDIDENILNQCLNALLDADPLCCGPDEDEIKRLEEKCSKMKIGINERLKYLKDQQIRYKDLDKRYNELIFSYNQLFEPSRTQSTTMPQNPEYPQQNIPYYPNYQYPQQYPSQNQPHPNPPYNFNYDPNNSYNQWNYR